jgi:molybdate transport system substrate-binding protein
VNGRRGGVLLVLATLLGACSGAAAGTSGAPSAAAIEMTVYAAASLKGAVPGVKSAYEVVAPGVVLTFATDSSSTLRTQIEQGAPADVFLSADETNPSVLVDAGLADGEAVDFAGNLLTIIVPIADPAGIASARDLARNGVKVIAAGPDVPITKYATQAVANLANRSGDADGFVARYEGNVVSKEDNVKAVVAKIELGEGDAAIVYATDAKASSKVKAIELPAEANVRAIYAGVVLKASAHVGEARAFLTWLAGTDGQAVLAEFGFVPPS